MKAKLIKSNTGDYSLIQSEEIIGFTLDLNYRLSVKNCEAIERGYDLNELSKEFSWLLSKDNINISRASYHAGFQKALEIINELRTHKDPKLIESMALRYRHDFGLITDENEKNIIRNKMCQLWEEVVGLGFYDVLNEWDVEIEMDPYYDGEFIDDGKTHIIEPKWKPRLDPNDCLILKRI
jgi:hypothetical protein